jgi:hypothetical protein
VITMSHQDGPRAVEIFLVVSFQVGNVRAIVYNDGLKAWKVSVEMMDVGRTLLPGTSLSI